MHTQGYWEMLDEQSRQSDLRRQTLVLYILLGFIAFIAMENTESEFA